MNLEQIDEESRKIKFKESTPFMKNKYKRKN